MSISPASAKPVVVNTVEDEDADDNDFCSLREAIVAAQSGVKANGCAAGKGGSVKITFKLDPADDTITLTNGTLPDIVAGVAINIVGPGAADLTIDANSRHFTVDGGNLTLSGVRLIGGSGSAQGGAIQVKDGGVLTLNDSVLNNNTTNDDGGAIFLSDSTATINRSLFFLNTAPGGNGGALFNVEGTVTINDSTFTGNSAFDRGGAVNNRSDTTAADMTIYHSTFAGNSTTGGGTFDDGGALNNEATLSGATATMTVSESTIVNNDAAGDGGGTNNKATVATSTANMTISNSSIVGNIAGGDGPDINNEGPGDANLALTNTVFDFCDGNGCFNL